MTRHAPPVRLGISAGLPDLRDSVRWAQAAESLGYDLVGYGDSPCLLPELHVALGAIASATERVVVCSTVTNPVTRHPSVVASAFGAAQQLARGRIRYCVGTGDSATQLIGEAPARVSELEAHCRAFRALTTGAEAHWHGRTFRLEWPVPPVPLWVAAEGPRSLRLAGELADGVVMGNGLTEAVVRDNLRRLRESAIAHGRDPERVEPWFMAKIVLCDSEEQAWHDLAWTSAASAHHAFRAGTDGRFVPTELRAPIDDLVNGYVTREHNNLARRGTRNADLVRDSGLAEFLGTRFLLAGPPGRILERIEELASWGATNLVTTAMFGDPFTYAAAVSDQVRSRLASAPARPAS